MSTTGAASVYRKIQVEERQIRVFLSSTFRDMQKERDVLVKKTFPQLRKLSEERGLTWTEVDLRWGVADEQKAEGRVLPLCLEEIERTRPYFIGILGERYGWVPNPEEFTDELLERQPWLKEHLDGHSVTELEIIHGVLRNRCMEDHAYFYFRDPKYLESVPSEKRQDFTTENAEAEAKLAKLKKKIRGARDEQACKLRENYSAPEQLGEWILDDFTKLIDRLYPKDQTPDPLDQEAARHEAFARSRRLAFVGRDDLLRRMDEQSSPGGKPLVLTGESGCGKSAILAEWVARWRKEHPDDLVIQHYIGSTPDSADWQRLVRRILSELKRAFAITDDIPPKPDSLRGALHDWTVKAAGPRRVVLVLDALNQLADDGAARQLGWLPDVFPGSFRVIVSSLPGESLEALQKRGWPELNVPLFTRADIAPAARAYFRIFSKTPPPDILAKMECTPAACNALYLRAVLDELRQFGIYEKLQAKAADYLSAPSPKDLFERILVRWHDDFGKDPEHPDLVYRSLCLIACARYGLAETELLNLLGQNGEPLPRRLWTPFYLAAENALAIQTGLLNFGHDYLRAAVRNRWLENADTLRTIHLQLADYFETQKAMTPRKAAEWPWQLNAAESWTRLESALTNFNLFLALYNDNTKWELTGYWLTLKALGRNMEAAYSNAYARFVTAQGRADPNYVLPHELGTFLFINGCYSEGESLLRRALESREVVLGRDDPATIASLDNLASLLQRIGNYAAAEALFHRALASSERILGPEHISTLTIVNNLATLLEDKGDYAAAEALFRRGLAMSESTQGPDHPYTITSVHNLAALFEHMGDYAAAETFYRRALATSERVLGPEHPDTLSTMSSLASLLSNNGNYSSAEPLFRNALIKIEHLLGPDHPQTLSLLNAFALFLSQNGDYASAEPLYRRVLSIHQRVLGPHHPLTLGALNNLGGVFAEKGDYATAEPLYRRALEGRERVLGRDHPDTLITVNNLAVLLSKRGDDFSAEPLYQRALETRERVLGPTHPDTLVTMFRLVMLRTKNGDTVSADLLFQRALLRSVANSGRLDMEQTGLRDLLDVYRGWLQTIGLEKAAIDARISELLREATALPQRARNSNQPSSQN